MCCNTWLRQRLTRKCRTICGYAFALEEEAERASHSGFGGHTDLAAVKLGELPGAPVVKYWFS